MKYKTSIEKYEVAEGKVSIGGIKWLPRWDVKVTFEKQYEAKAFQKKLNQPAAWVGLTPAEQMEVAVDCDCVSADWLNVVKAVEAALKRKNT